MPIKIKLRHYLKTEKGSALLMVLIFVTIFGIMGSSLIYLTGTHHQNVLKDELKIQSYYAAEAGVLEGINLVEENRGNLRSSPIKLDGLLDQNRIGLSYSIEVSREGSEYLVKSIGTARLNNMLQSNTTINVVLSKKKPFKEIRDNSAFNYTIFSKEDLYLGQEEVNYESFSLSIPFLPEIEFKNKIPLKNNLKILGDVYSGKKIYLYNGDKLYNQADNGGFEFLFSMDLTGNHPEFIDSTLVTEESNHLKELGYEIKLYKNWKIVLSSESKNLNGESFNTSIQENPLKKQSNIQDIAEKLEGNDKMKEINGDLVITNRNKADLNGWIHVKGDLLIEEGVEITDLQELVVVTDGGILIGFNEALTSRANDNPVKIKGEDILFLAKSNMEEDKQDKAPNRNYQWWAIDSAVSYLNEYTDNNKKEKWRNVGILTSNNTEIDGWLVADKEIVFDYKVDDLFHNQRPTIKVRDGVIAEKIVFPKAIEVGDEGLYIYGWEVN